MQIGGAFASLPAVDGVFGLNTWDLDSQTPTPQQTWLNFVLPQLACKHLPFYIDLKILINISSRGFHGRTGSKWGWNNGFWIHRFDKIHRQPHIHSRRSP
jgi:hypothetical protein